MRIGELHRRKCMTSISKAMISKKRLASQLVGLPGVVGVGIGGSESDAKLVVNVVELTEQLKAKIPKEFDGVQVEVLETGEFKAL